MVLLGGLASLAGLAGLTLKLWGPFPHNAAESNGAQSDPSCVREPCIRALSRAPQQETRLNVFPSLPVWPRCWCIVPPGLVYARAQIVGAQMGHGRIEKKLFVFFAWLSHTFRIGFAYPDRASCLVGHPCTGDGPPQGISRAPTPCISLIFIEFH